MSHSEITLADGNVVLVSNEDYVSLSQTAWHIGTSGYVVNRNKVDRVNKTIRMHNEVMRLHGIEIPEGMEVDHENRHRLDNRFGNLRLCTRGLNLANKPYKNALGFRGVQKRVDGNYVGYRGIVQLNGVVSRTKSFHTPEEAAIARDELAKQIHGEFATLNF
jgi:hypothetical protein